MPPGPGYNWVCVLSSATEIIGHASRYRAAQVARLSRDGRPVKEARAAAVENDWNDMKLKMEIVENRLEHSGSATNLHTPSDNAESASQPLPAPGGIQDQESDSFQANKSPYAEAQTPKKTAEPAKPSVPSSDSILDSAYPASSDAAPSSGSNDPAPAPFTSTTTPRNTLQSSKVPSSKLGRLFHYGGLAASLGYGAASELLRSSTSSNASSDGSNRSIMLTDANIGRLVSKLSQMRGAALKLGQFLSIQDTHLLPPEIDAVFRRVQDSAHYMPDWQMEQVMSAALGLSWATEYFESFTRIPFAAASIGQVHEGVLKAIWSPTGQPAKVAVKVQFPNIRDSISADLSYITWLLRVTLGGRILPKGLFLDRTMEVMKAELADECDYTREAGFLEKFRSPEFLGGDSRFHVPWASSISSDRVLVMEYVEGGVSLGSELITALPQKEKDNIATTILHLCLLELFRFGTMQTDPNYSNFLYLPDSGKIALVDFGATREYGPEFLDGWRKLLEAAASLDLNDSSQDSSSAWNACVKESISLGYLVGGPGEGEGGEGFSESPEMVKAHVTSLGLLAYPFNAKTPQPVRFGPGSDFGKNTERIRNELIPVMLHERKKGPPRETYSLNRKLSGTFLLSSRLGATVNARDIWDDVLMVSKAN
ncbi:hypothetical protein D9757_009379 [Collybiopsis confluens]|uniref:ABC1 atypical kinase-like domain-containing protein n=1 Tax=Collybiopsis confluens TaxID=2823264 RepID=A0A8H5H6M5_9AGAR|nr:hypothetical protein D9757_009379 [Collybiopsis confluens]